MSRDVLGNSAATQAQDTSSADRSSFRRFVTFLQSRWDFLAVLLLVLASLPVTWLSPSSVMVIPHPGMFDEHWDIDTVFRAAHGSWFGRDVAFVYGPIFEWLFSAPSRWAGLSLTAVYASYNTLLLWCVFLFGYITLRLLLPEQPNWKRFLLLLLLSVFWAPWDARTSFAIFLFALFLRGWYAVQAGRIKPLVLGGGGALLCAIAFLYSADTGVYGIAALLITLAGVAFESRREAETRSRYFLALLSFGVVFAALVLAINMFMASALNFQFWRSSLALVNVHRWNEPSTMEQAETIRLLGVLLAGAVIFLARYFVSADREKTIVAKPAFLLTAFGFALLTMQSGLIRSDPMHVVFAVFAMVFLGAVVLLSFSSRLVSIGAAVVLGACSLLYGLPTTMFRPSNIRYRLGQLKHASTECPAGFEEFKEVCYPARFVSMLNVADNFLNQHSNSGDSILIFPYQYMYGMTSGHNVAGGVLQSFLASGPYLSQLDIDGMANSAAPAGLYFPDGELSQRIDDVSNFTRTPDIWFWILRHYVAGPELFPGVVALQRADSRASRISLEPTSIGLEQRTYPIEGSNGTVNLGAPAWPGDADFLRLRLKLDYGLSWKLRKPAQLQLEITRADGSRDLRPFVAEPNVSSEIWFYPWNESELASYFADDQSRWRTASHAAITQLRLITTPFDWVSEQPRSISIEAADAVRVTMRP